MNMCPCQHVFIIDLRLLVPADFGGNGKGIWDFLSIRCGKGNIPGGSHGKACGLSSSAGSTGRTAESAQHPPGGGGSEEQGCCIQN